MKICYLSTSTLISDSANSVHVTKMCQAFSRQGHDVTLHGLLGDGDDAAVFEYYGIDSPITVMRHDEHADPIAGRLWALRRISPRLCTTGLPSTMFARHHLTPLIRAAKPDLIYSRNLPWLTGLAVAVPFIAESHKPPRSHLKRLAEARIYKRPGFRKLVVISDKLKQLYLQAFPWLEERVVVAHDAADDPHPDTYSPSQRSGFNVGYVGHLYDGRGIDLILDVAKSLPEATFHLVGGRKEDQCRLIASGAVDNVIFHGHKPPHSLPEYYANFDAVLAPYQRRVSVAGNRDDTSAYMSPLKIFEYMSWGKPILCSDLPVLREVLEDGQNALLLPPESATAWTNALRRLLSDEKERQRLGDRARQDFLEHYSWNIRAENVLK